MIPDWRRGFDEWRGDLAGRPVMFVKRLLEWRGYRVDLHLFVDGDAPECFHTHPAWAIRWVLAGGYVEEVEGRGYRRRGPGYLGIVKPSLSHRIEMLLTGASWSLWIRFPKVADVRLRGEGWRNPS